MPSKRTNDSVDRILEDLNIQQAQAGLRDSVTDRQVDEILRSVGITSAPAQPVPDRSPVSGADGGLDALLQQPAAAVQPAPRTARQTQPTTYTPARQPVQPVQSTRPPQQTMPTPAAAENTTGSLGYDGDTTRTGIIKDFLLKMAPDGSAADTDALNQGKNQFQKFFIVYHITFVHEYNDVRNTYLTRKQDVLSCLSHNTISSSYNKDSSIHLSSSCDHVLNVVSMSWAVNVCIVTFLCLVLNVSCRNCDTTLSLFRSFIDIFEVLSSVSFYSGRKYFCDSCGQSCFTMVNVADGTNVTMRFCSLKLSFCHFKTSSLKQLALILL